MKSWVGWCHLSSALLSVFCLFSGIAAFIVGAALSTPPVPPDTLNTLPYRLDLIGLGLFGGCMFFGVVEIVLRGLFTDHFDQLCQMDEAESYLRQGLWAFPVGLLIKKK